jgi:hypothetical protein
LDELTRLPAELKPEVARRFNWDAQMLRRVFSLKTAIPLPANLCFAACAHGARSRRMRRLSKADALRLTSMPSPAALVCRARVQQV